MANNKESERAELHKTIWRIANDLRGSVDGQSNTPVIP
jgi:type I restriction enzyme M protein